METLAQPAYKSRASRCCLSVGNVWLPRQDPWGLSQQPWSELSAFQMSLLQTVDPFPAFPRALQEGIVCPDSPVDFTGPVQSSLEL